MQTSKEPEVLATSCPERATENEDASLYDYDVFLSFRGPDTRASFTDVLYDHMSRAGLRVFRDDDELQLGDEISKILQEIDNSKLCIPIFSKTFAASKWCLLEVTKMVELNKHILPIFFDVTMEDVNLETSMYNKFMDEHASKYKANEVGKWKEALKTISAIEGKEVLNTGYTTFCENLVKELLIKLKSRRKIEIDSPIGLEDQVQHAMELLDIQSFGVRYIGICGMGGIGKTTLAKDIFDKIAEQFDSCTFLGDVRESSRRHGIKYLLEKLVNGLGVPTTGRDYEQLSRIIKECFRRKKILIVLDDVDKWEQIEKLAEKSSWFGSGSRIIVTTRNMIILETGNGRLSEHEVRSFEMKPLGKDAAQQLFNRHAFKEGTPMTGFEELSTEAASLTGGLPLALKVIGSFLYNRKREIWREVIKKLKEIPESEVTKRLKISYDALMDEHKQIFLDVACFFVGMRRTYPVYMWKACKFCPLSGLEVLCSMSLVKVSDDGEISMHDQLRDLGRDIVREENIMIPAKRSRLWEDDTSRKVLMSRKDKQIVEGVRVDGYCAINLMQGEIGSLENMRFLELQQANLKGDFEDLFPNLIWLSYHCVEDFEVANFSMKNLVVLDFSNSTVDQSWGGWSQLKNAEQLKVLDLTGAKCLTRTPYFPKGMPLERLILDGCRKLEAIDCSIGNLKCLKYLNLDGCVSLTNLPEEIGILEHLNEVFVAGDDQSFTLPESFGELMELRSLTLRYLEIMELPGSFGNLNSLVDLNIQSTEIVNLSDSIKGLVKLENLSVVGSDKVQKLPDTLGAMKSLVILDLAYSGLVELPNCIGQLPRLQRLNLAQCFIEKLPESLGTIKSLVELDLTFTEIVQLPESIKGLENLEKLSLSNCTKLEALPDAIGDLKSLVKLQLSGTAITKLPESIGGLENLREISLEHCLGLITLPKTIGALKRLEILKAESANLSGGLPDEISGLSSLRVLNLSHSQVCELPSSIKQLPFLHELHLLNCDQLQQLPDLPVNLSKLNVLSRTMVRVPDLSKLQSLTKLALVCGVEIYNSDFGISMLSQLVELRLGHAAITTLPDEFGNLSELKTLWLGCPSMENVPRLPSNLEEMFLLGVHRDMDLPNLPDLGKLSFLEVKDWSVGGSLRLHFPEGLRDLYVSDCPRLASLPAISHLKELRNLHLLRCPGLTGIPGLGKLKSLQYLNIDSCDSLLELENMSELKEIQSVRVVSCRKLRGIRGVDASKINIFGEDSQEMSGDSAHEVITGERHDISSLLSSPGRDFLVRRNGHQVKIDRLKGKKVWLYLCGSSWDTFDLILMAVYDVFYPEGDFEVVFVSDNLNKESFDGDFGRMSWLAVPYSDLDKRRSLRKLFKAHGHDIPQLLILDESGKVLTTKGFEIILSKAILPVNPLSPEKIEEYQSITETSRRNQSLKSLFGKDYPIISFDGFQMPGSELEGKIVGIYFSSSSYRKYDEFNSKLLDVLLQLKAEGKSFEILWAPIEADYDFYDKIFRTPSMLTLTRWYESCIRLYFHFGVSTLPTLVIVGADGKIIQPNAAEAVSEYGADAYPFSPEKIAQKREEAEGLVISTCREFAITNRRDQVHVSELVGKNILLYFSAPRISRSCTFLPKLIEAYHEIKARDEAFEVIFISDDDDEEDEASFREYSSTMPWLALPFRDERIESLFDVLNIRKIPRLVAIGPTDRIITKDAMSLIIAYGAEAYPFTDEHIGNKAKGWPCKLSHTLHDHELTLTRRDYVCDGCINDGYVWSYFCEECAFDLHPECALKEGKWERTAEASEPWVGLRILFKTDE